MDASYGRLIEMKKKVEEFEKKVHLIRETIVNGEQQIEYLIHKYNEYNFDYGENDCTIIYKGENYKQDADQLYKNLIASTNDFSFLKDFFTERQPQMFDKFEYYLNHALYYIRTEVDVISYGIVHNPINYYID